MLGTSHRSLAAVVVAVAALAACGGDDETSTTTTAGATSGATSSSGAGGGAAASSSSASGASTTAGSGGSGGGASGPLEAGTYDLDDRTLGTNTCGFGVGDLHDSLTIEAAGGADYDLTPGTFVKVACSLDSGETELTCEAGGVETDYTDSGIAAKLSSVHTSSLELDSPTSGTHTFSLELSCDGEETPCTALMGNLGVSALPCQVEMTADATLGE